MLSTGSSPLAAVQSSMRGGMWGWLMFAGVAWLAVSWSVLRLEPADVVHVAGPVVLFGALTEALRACAGARTWWMNAGMAVLFAVTGCVLLAEQSSSYTTPAALVGWYLMVRGAVDVAVAVMTRGSDRIWGLILVVGVLETGLGFFAASPLSRTADLVVTVLGGLGLLRAVADLVTGLRLREVRAQRANVLELSEERAAGLTGYTAGIDDYEAAPPKAKPRHRAAKPVSRVETAGQPMWPSGPSVPAAGAAGGGPAAVAEPGLAAAGGMAAAGYTAGGGTAAEQPGPIIVPGTSEGSGGDLTFSGGPVFSGSYTTATGTPETSGPVAGADSFHDEVLRTTADLDAMLALAGVTGAAVGAHFDDENLPAAPDTPEGVEETADEQAR
ncbi:hypothetical protein AB0M20_07675 [Actinoplanes sp. NPDC051633]|uniref:HdeD family acid-resistance protein n=1 Tax=Actinoplanes sp. NPDC051633 TaxID=3155670 RepID=UPI00341B46E4